MKTDFEDIIREAAVKNRTTLHPDDPVMIIVTVFNRLSSDLVVEFKNEQERQKKELTQTSLKWMKDATARANVVLNAALDAGRQSMAKGMEEGAAQVMTIVKEQTEDALGKHKVELLRTLSAFRRWVLYTCGGLVAIELIVKVFL